MVTDEEAKKAAEVLVEYCNEYGECKGCPFDGYPTCVLSVPVVWNL